MRPGARALAVVTVAVAAAPLGCLPFALPPARASITASSDDPHELNARATVHPQQFAKEWMDRPVDIGLGVVSDSDPDEDYVSTVGPGLEVGAYPGRASFSEGDAIARGGLVHHVDLHVTTDAVTRELLGDAYVAGALLAAVEVAWFGEGFGSSKDVIGVFYGEMALGVWAGIRGRIEPDAFVVTPAIGLSIRLPFLAGIVCCVWPK